jgi:hypothetical protein
VSDAVLAAIIGGAATIVAAIVGAGAIALFRSRRRKSEQSATQQPAAKKIEAPDAKSPWELDADGYPAYLGISEDTAKARALLDLFKRPKSGQRGGKIPATVLRVLVKRLRAATTLGVYLLTTARAVSAANVAAQRERGRPVVRFEPPAPMIIEPVATTTRAGGGWPRSEEVKGT